MQPNVTGMSHYFYSKYDLQENVLFFFIQIARRVVTKRLDFIIKKRRNMTKLTQTG